MIAPDNDTDDDRFAKLLDDLNNQLETGDHTTTFDDTDDPALKARLSDARECLEILHSIWPQRSSTEDLPLRDTIALFDFCARAEVESTPDRMGRDPDDSNLKHSANTERGDLGVIGRFRIKKELGRGGHGIVFLAFDPLLKRQVALKVPRPENLISRSKRDRFQREAQLAARLDHPNLLQIFEIGEIGPITFLVTAYCPGQSLSVWLKSQSTPLAPDKVVQFLLPLVDAVSFMHAHGVIHRDIKPGNILLDQSLEATSSRAGSSVGIPKLTDFGLSVLSDLSERQTRTGSVIGTLAYMAPEQVEAKDGSIGPKLDIYSLGIVLYECLTGRLPFDGSTEADLMRRLLTDDPISPRRLRQAISRDLEVICLKCIEKEPSQRYASAAELVADLRSYLAGEPIRAKPAGPMQRLTKWARRRPAVASLTLVTFLTFCTIIGMGVRYDIASRQYNQSLQVALRATEASERRLSLENYAFQIQLAESIKTGDQRGSLKGLLDGLIPKPGQQDNRGFEWYYLRNVASRERTLRGHRTSVDQTDILPDGRTLVTRDEGAICIWDLATEKLTAEIGTAELPFPAMSKKFTIRYGNSYKELFCLFRQNDVDQLVVWNINSRSEITRLPKSHYARIFDIASSVNEDLIWVLLQKQDLSREVISWSWRTGVAKNYSLPQQLSVANEDDKLLISVSPKGTYVVVTACREKGVAVLEQSPEKGFKWIETGDSGVVSHSWADDESSLVTLVGPRTIIRWKPPGFGRIRILREVEDVYPQKISVASQGKFLAWGVRSINESPKKYRFYLEDAQTGGFVAEFDPGSAIHDLACTSDGQIYAIGCADHQVKLWSPSSPPTTSELTVKGQKEAWAVAFSPDSETLAVGYDDEPGMDVETIKLWNVHTRQEVHHLDGHHSMVMGLAFTADGRQLYSAGYDKKVKIWDLANDSLRGDIGSHTLEIRTLALSADGQTIATGGLDNIVKLWDPKTGNVKQELVGHAERIHFVAFDPAGKFLATSDNTFEVRLWDAKTGLLSRMIKDVHPVVGISFTPDGTRLATINQEGVISIYETMNDAPRVDLLGHQKDAMAVAFSPDGKTLASGGSDGVRLWHVATGRELLHFDGLPARVNRLAFSPNQKHLAAALMDGSVYLWHAIRNHPSSN